MSFCYHINDITCSKCSREKQALYEELMQKYQQPIRVMPNPTGSLYEPRLQKLEEDVREIKQMLKKILKQSTR